MSTIDEQYRVPLIAELLNSLLHYNVTIHQTSNTFRPNDPVYLRVRFSEFTAKLQRYWNDLSFRSADVFVVIIVVALPLDSLQTIFCFFFSFLSHLQNLAGICFIPACLLLLLTSLLSKYLFRRFCDLKPPQTRRSRTTLKEFFDKNKGMQRTMYVLMGLCCAISGLGKCYTHAIYQSPFPFFIQVLDLFCLCVCVWCLPTKKLWSFPLF